MRKEKTTLKAILFKVELAIMSETPLDRVLNQPQVEFLIEQAEKVEEKDKAFMVTVDELVEVTAKVKELEEQNKRYKEALEFYADDETYKRYYDQAPPSQIENDEGQIAKHALKEEGGGAK